MKPLEADSNWDLIVIGGGVTGAGIFSEAVRMGLQVLLLEKHDFAWGTSSRSSKMVHGGLRYLKEGKPLLTRASVKERQRLLAEAPGLVDPLGFLLPVFTDFGPSKTIMALGLTVYSLMATEKQHQAYDAAEISARIPGLRQKNLSGGFYFRDAQTDDARLVLRLINEAAAAGGTAKNYTAAEKIIRDQKGRVAAVAVRDAETGRSAELHTKAVINATGAWAETLHPSPRHGLHLRPLRGSHLIFPRTAFPADHVVSFMHPADKRPVFMFPWEGVAILGTTDVDHAGGLDTDPAITAAEADYLMEGMDFIMPELPLAKADAFASIAGVRPVLSRGKADPSHESREHVVWENQGLVTVTGGKLTTFRLLARDALKAAADNLPQCALPPDRDPVFTPPAQRPGLKNLLTPATRQRLYGRYGRQADIILDFCRQHTPAVIPKTNILWAEISFAAAHEQVHHLTDLLLRRVRLGLLAPEGGRRHLDAIGDLCRPALGWDKHRWEKEKTDYLETWRRYYGPPER
ncbi:glycerol-3-phosphate dehydrogenase [Desulfosalsimonas propionicica]|uniref:Glycerol-3-phosphate dehydrogenase n=1 Tax=Desulfosalsimonas propionicica TaxID=332175 RepID=A0A7W0CA58_9BACT|nr:glycerol-3-phosphate dehydrogenase/oxidase [Desulfosalsimonas propionicica]MBA2881889.1 glycerol-3-phosphate dehydrogenase [Desulfosalsimonas propionicica]